MRSFLSELVLRLREAARALLGRSKRVVLGDPRVRDETDEGEKFSTAWFRRLYADLGDGTRCYRPPEDADYGGGCLDTCACCGPDTQLHLLPNEERVLAHAFNDGDFRLVDHPHLEGRKSITCNKFGKCGDDKPFTCRTHPVYFMHGNMLFEESLCRLLAVKYLGMHADSVDHIRDTVFGYGLENETLGYGRNLSTKDGDIHVDLDR